MAEQTVTVTLSHLEKLWDRAYRHGFDDGRERTMVEIRQDSDNVRRVRNAIEDVVRVADARAKTASVQAPEAPAHA